MNVKNFFLCGITGWCMEVFFTAAGSLLAGDLRLTAKTSLWMFPIYGLAFFIGPVSKKLLKWPLLARGVLYGAAIMLVEFISGSILYYFSVCPWDYTGSRYNIAGIVRLDYFPFWVLAGLVYERILCGQGTLYTKLLRGIPTKANSNLPLS